MKGYLAALIVLGLPMSSLAAADPKEAPRLPPAEIIKAWSAADAWKDAGAVVGCVRPLSRTHESPPWLPPVASFRPDFQAQNIGAIKGLPVFRFADWEMGVLVKLPDPGFPFGLMLSSRKLTGVELNRGLQELSGLEKLQALYLWDTKVTDAEMREIAKLKNLQTLDLGDTQVTDQGLKALAGMKNLQTLNLSGTQVSDAGLKELAGLKNLQMLYLVGTKVKGSGLKELAGLKNLQVLLTIPELVRNAVERGLPFMEKGAMKWQKDMKCAGCHLVTTNIWAQSEARSRGFKIQDEALDHLRDWAISWDKPGAENAAALEDRDGSGSDLNTVYLMLASTSAVNLDDKTAAALKKMSAYILSRQAADGPWKLVDNLSPPIIDVVEVQTMQALLALAAAHDKGLVDEKAWNSARDRALDWLGKNKFLDQNQSWNMRVLVAQRFGKPEEVHALVKELLEQQNADGGWSQTRDRPSDSMATGQTLYALTTAGVSSQGPAVQRAQAFLIGEQVEPSGKNKGEGGFWAVNSRGGSKNMMTTTFGTGWATLGLMRTLPVQGEVSFVTDPFPWAEVEAFAAAVPNDAALAARLVTANFPKDQNPFDYEVMRMQAYHRCEQEMLNAERLALANAPNVPALVDGKLAGRIGSKAAQARPLVVGVVKRTPPRLHPEGWRTLLALRPGQRTPAFKLTGVSQGKEADMPTISWFLKLAGGPRLAPNWGHVRIDVPWVQFIGAHGSDFGCIDRLSRWLMDARCRVDSYARMPVSLDPIVRAEEALKPLFTPLPLLVNRLHRRAGLFRRNEV